MSRRPASPRRPLAPWFVLLAAAATGACATAGSGVGGGDADADAEVPVDGGLDDDGPGPGPDVSVDAGQDASVDTAQDTWVDPGTDSGGPEAGPEGSVEGGTDARADAPHDAPADAPHDAAHDATADAGHDAGHDASTDSGGGDGAVVPQPTQGEVLITEVMYNPSTTEPTTEWVELLSTVASPRRLSGLILKDGAGRTHTIASSPEVLLPAGAYAVLARLKADCVTLAKVPAGAILYEYGAGLPSTSGVQLANSATGAVLLLDAAGATTLAQAPYGPWSLGASGQGIQLKNLTFADESLKASWCKSTHPWATGADDGTPGAAGDCP